MTTSTVLTFCVVVVAGFLLAMKICFASKCDDVKICYGLLSIHRNVNAEHAEISNNENLFQQITQMRNVVDRNQEAVLPHSVEPV